MMRAMWRSAGSTLAVEFERQSLSDRPCVAVGVDADDDVLRVRNAVNVWVGPGERIHDEISHRQRRDTN